MKPYALSLRTQLAAIMILAIFLAILFGYVGLDLFGRWQANELLHALDPSARQTLDAIHAGRVPPAPAVVVLYNETERIAHEVDQAQRIVLVGLAVPAISVGVYVGLLLATRLIRPLTTIGRAARSIASGDLSARASERHPGAGELGLLLSDFNCMADALEAYDRDLREGSAAIAHELRTPLTVLLGSLQAQLDGLFATDAAAIRALIQQVELLVRIVDDLQTLSLAYTGRLELHPEPTDLAELVATNLHALGPMLAASGLALETALAATPSRVDRQRMGQVVLALVDNVRRHAGAGGILRVETRYERGWAKLAILDRGPGMPEHATRQAFVRFWRAEPSRSREHGGSGLGLAVVKAVVNAHGGDVAAMNRVEGGIAIRIRLPIAADQFDTAA